MTSLFNRWIPSLTLAIWSAVLLATHATGRVTAFLHPSFRPGVFLAGIVLAALALLIASRPTPPECCADASCTHPLSRSKAGRWMTFLILVLPVTVAAWFSPENFSKQLIENRGISTDATGLGERRTTAPKGGSPETSQPSPNAASNPTGELAQAQAPAANPATAATAPTPAAEPAAPGPSGLPTAQSGPNPQNLPEYLQRTPDGYIVAEILDLLYSVQDSQLRKDFEGKTIQLVAQAMPDKKAGSGTNRFKAVRMFMTCCAADARPVATLIQADNAADFPEMSWVKIVGKATFPIENGKRTALVEATSVQPTKPPEESMLFQ